MIVKISRPFCFRNFKQAWPIFTPSGMFSAVAWTIISNMPVKTEQRSSELTETLQELAARCQGPEEHVQDLLNVAEFDQDRKEDLRIGVVPLAAAYFQNAGCHWLSPVDALQQLSGNLLKYRAPMQSLRPFLTLLTEAAENGISPHALLTYIFMPRMGSDFNWRRWQERHWRALKAVTDLLIAMKEQPPFDKPVIGSGRLKLVRDIVLVKYAGRPLSGYAPSILEDPDFTRRYRELWQKFRLDNLFGVYFLRRNLLNLIYKFSGRLDTQQLTALLARAPDIERAFTEIYDDSLAADPKSLSQYRKIHLYDADMNRSLEERRRKGFTDFDFAVEAKAYMELMARLMETSSGLYLGSHFASILSRYKDPAIAAALVRLVSELRDTGGRYSYLWHSREMLKLSKEEHQGFIELVHFNNGLHPDYPGLDTIFTDHYTSESLRELLDLAHRLDYPIRPGEKLTYSLLLNHFLRQHPQEKELYDRFRSDILQGNDRSWKPCFTAEIDGSFPRDLHRGLMKSIIKGIDTGYAKGVKAGSLSELYRHFGTAANLPCPAASLEFQLPLPDRKAGSGTEAASVYLRKKIKMTMITKAWTALYPENGEAVPLNVVQRLNQKSLELKAAAEKLQNKRLMAGEAKKEASLIKRIERLAAERERCEKVMRSLPDLTPDARFLAEFLICGDLGGKDGEWNRLGFDLLKKRYAGAPLLQERLSVLQQDVVITALSLTQLDYFLNTLHTLQYNLLNDPGLERLLDSESPLQDIIAPFLRVRDKTLSIRALDAAFHRITSLTKLIHERNRWKQLQDGTGKEGGGTCRNMRLSTSKSFIDAYYGDMGGTCLSASPFRILERNLINIRLVDIDAGTITGMALMAFNATPCPELGLSCYWFAFAINPLQSFLFKLGEEQQEALYRQYRRLFQRVADKTGCAVLLPGLSAWGLISNNTAFADLIKSHEARRTPAGAVTDRARGYSLYYGEEAFSHARVLCLPRL